VLPLKPQKSPTIKRSATPVDDLPSVSSGAPKLRHLCNDRPRRMKTTASTRPMVGLTHAEDAADEDAEDVFFTPPSSQNTSTADNGIVNGELEKG